MPKSRVKTTRTVEAVGKTPLCGETIFRSTNDKTGRVSYYHMSHGKKVYDTTRVSRGQLDMSGVRRGRKARM